MTMWEKHVIETSRGQFELFKKGEGEPLVLPICIVNLTKMEIYLRIVLVINIRFI